MLIVPTVYTKKYLWRTNEMKKKIKNFLHNFYKGAYAVGYRHTSDNITHFNSSQPFEVIEPTLHRWFADSFPFVENGKEYIFVEILDDVNGEKGTIGVIDLQDNKGFVEIINEPFHMSFPNVFKYGNDIYMMPETSESNQLRLYKAIEFPYKWRLESVLYDSVAVVDTVFLKADNELYAIGQKLPEKSNVLFKINTTEWKAELLNLEGSYLDKRPAGNFINYENGTFHALQECGRVYGEYLHICKLDSFDGTTLNETEVGTYSVSDMKINSKRNYRRVHTFNRMGNLEVIDLLYYQINPTIITEKIKVNLRKKERRSINE